MPSSLTLPIGSSRLSRKRRHLAQRTHARRRSGPSASARSRTGSRSPVRSRASISLRRASSRRCSSRSFPLFWVADATHRAIAHHASAATRASSSTSRGRCASGDVDYRDVRDVNGPLIASHPLAAHRSGGARRASLPRARPLVDRHHVRDRGRVLPGLVAEQRPDVARARAGRPRRGSCSPRSTRSTSTGTRRSARASAIGSSCRASRSRSLRPAKTKRGAVVADRVHRRVSRSITWFGKPSFALFTPSQLGVLLLGSRSGALRRQELVRFAMGGAIGALVPLAYLLRYGDARAFCADHRRRRARDLSLHLGEARAGDPRLRRAAHDDGRGHGGRRARHGLVVARELPRRARPRARFRRSPSCTSSPAEGLRLPLPPAHRRDLARVARARRDALATRALRAAHDAARALARVRSRDDARALHDEGDERLAEPPSRAGCSPARRRRTSAGSRSTSISSRATTSSRGTCVSPPSTSSQKTKPEERVQVYSGWIRTSSFWRGADRRRRTSTRTT